MQQLLFLPYSVSIAYKSKLLNMLSLADWPVDVILFSTSDTGEF